MMTISMMKKLLFALLAIAYLTDLARGQGRAVTGKVLSLEYGLPLPVV